MQNSCLKKCAALPMPISNKHLRLSN